MDSLKNFAIGTVSTGYDDAATSVVLTTGHGARFPTTAFYAVWWNATDYANPADDPNVEIVRVTSRSTDTLTVTRAQEGTSASTKNTGDKTYKMMQSVTAALLYQIGVEFVIACSDEATDLTTTGNPKVTWRAPYAFRLTAVRASVNTAPVGSTIIVDINNGANSMLSTKLSIDASEETSTTAATAAVIDGTYDNVSDDAEITIDIDQVGSSTAGKGLKVTLIGVRE